MNLCLVIRWAKNFARPFELPYQPKPKTKKQKDSATSIFWDSNDLEKEQRMLSAKQSLQRSAKYIVSCLNISMQHSIDVGYIQITVKFVRFVAYEIKFTKCGLYYNGNTTLCVYIQFNTNTSPYLSSRSKIPLIMLTLGYGSYQKMKYTDIMNIFKSTKSFLHNNKRNISQQ